jgi:hypothetical protein
MSHINDARRSPEPSILVDLSARMIEFRATFCLPVVTDLTVITVPRVNAKQLESVFLQKPVAVMPLQR